MRRDIRLDASFLDNIKTRKLIRDLGEKGVVCVIRLWSYIAVRHTKGQMNGATEDDIEIMAGWDGEQGKFAAYTICNGWVDKNEYGLSIHDWKEHQPWVYHFDKRSEIAKTNIAARWDKHKKQTLNTSGIPFVLPNDTNGNTPFPIPSPSPKDQIPIVLRAKPARFTIPTVDEVRAYCEARQNAVDPVKFHAFYTSNGWKVGRNPMKKWKAAIVTWEKN